MPLVLSIVIGSIIIVSAGFGVAYRIWFRPPVCAHFGEEFPSRRDREATGRRRAFERRCGQAATFLFFSMVAGVARGIVSDLFPELSTIAVAAQIAFLVIAGLFVWAAISRWRAPLED